MNRNTLALLVLLLVTALAYTPVRTATFVYEDANAVWQNATVVSGAPIPVNRARWLTALSHRLVFTAFGPGPLAPHVVNVALHLANGTLVYALAAAFVSPPAALLAAGLFLLHPLQTEAVAYVASRSELLSTLFALLAAWLALDARRWWEQAAVAGCVALAVCAKESAAVIVPLILLMQLAGGRTVSRGWVLAVTVPIAAMAVSVFLFDFQTASELGPWRFAATQATALWRYLALLVPVGQTIDHDFDLVPWLVRWTALGALGAWTALALLAGLSTLDGETGRTGRIWSGSSRLRCVAWGTAWVLVALAPRFVMRIPEFLNEHQMYLPMAGICFTLSVLIMGTEQGATV